MLYFRQFHAFMAMFDFGWIRRTSVDRFQSYLAVHDGAQAPVHVVGTAIFIDRLLATVAMHRPVVRPRSSDRTDLRASH